MPHEGCSHGTARDTASPERQILIGSSQSVLRANLNGKQPMIIGERFVWLHFPKCAGTEVEAILRELLKNDKRVMFDDLDPKSNKVIWHQNIAQREAMDPTFILGERDVICNFRRLPYWLLSRIHYEKARSPHIVVTRDMFLIKGQFLGRDSVISSADQVAKKYSSRPVKHWLRTENLETDFIAVFSKYIDLDSLDVKNRFRRKNKGVLRYIQDLEFYFKPHELEKLYFYNPLWASIERSIYGDILTL